MYLLRDKKTLSALLLLFIVFPIKLYRIIGSILEILFLYILVIPVFLNRNKLTLLGKSLWQTVLLGR